MHVLTPVQMLFARSGSQTSHLGRRIECFHRLQPSLGAADVGGGHLKLHLISVHLLSFSSSESQPVIAIYSSGRLHISGSLLFMREKNNLMCVLVVCRTRVDGGRAARQYATSQAVVKRRPSYLSQSARM